MSDSSFDVVLNRHREVWQRRAWWRAAMAFSAGVVAGYLVAKWLG